MAKQGDLFEKMIRAEQKRLKTAERTGSALKGDIHHRIASFGLQEKRKGAMVFHRQNGEVLTQVPGEQVKPEGQKSRGIFEAVRKEGKVVHQRWVEGGKVTGKTNQEVPKKKVEVTSNERKTMKSSTQKERGKPKPVAVKPPSELAKPKPEAIKPEVKGQKERSKPKPIFIKPSSEAAKPKAEAPKPQPEKPKSEVTTQKESPKKK